MRTAFDSRLRDLAVTTNGVLLAAQPELFDAGLRRLNVSLDTLDPQRFHLLARRDGLDRVLEGLAVAREIGFDGSKSMPLSSAAPTMSILFPWVGPPASMVGN